MESDCLTSCSVPFSGISQLSFKDITYQENPEKLSDFISYIPDYEGIAQAIENRNKFKIDRELLVKTLSENYANIGTKSLQEENIQALTKENSYTIVTAHQPALLTGPAYYFYKIFSTIRLTQNLNQLHPDKKFVPVFISGAEDHDFDEVNHLTLFGKKVEWNTDQTGPVGRFSVTGLDTVIEEISGMLGGSFAEELSKIFRNSISNAVTYNDFVFRILNALFGDYGLLVVNMDNKELKRHSIPIMEKEIVDRPSEKLVLKTQSDLLKLNFKPQAYPRDINLFYMQDQSRERIYFEGERYYINNTNLSFSEAEIIAELHRSPEKFSPNVVMRPLYQEYILPNIAYIGGGGEIAYWLERKEQFKHFNIFFPVLIRRNSLLLVTSSQLKTIQKLGFTASEIFKEEHELINQYIENASATDFHLAGETEEIRVVFDKIASKAKIIDPTLEHYVLGEGVKLLKAVEHIEGRFKKSLKQKEDVSLNQIKNIKSKLFPSNGLQERDESFLPILAMGGRDLMDKIIYACDPMNKSFLIFFV
ncbi:MAG: bacillithiol biosynthesis cysteine-adding enzyme BshC [Saprospiraceae bacterium]|nr:bacillithiol biosynthesis cysteine-adding enzyme BshC [Saprospiraceae bacterium]